MDALRISALGRVSKTNAAAHGDTIFVKRDRSPKNKGKYTADQIREIRRSYETDKVLAQRYGTTPNYIKAIRAGVTYAWVY